MNTAPPSPDSWYSAEQIRPLMDRSPRDVSEYLRSGRTAQVFDAHTVETISDIQLRLAEQEGNGQLNRIVHRRQLFGGAVEMHWNPHLGQLFKFFHNPITPGLLRISDASSAANPDGPSSYGMALEILDGDEATDFLFSGGSPRFEVALAGSAEAQLAFFNLLGRGTSQKISGLARIFLDAGLWSGLKMLRTYEKTRVYLPSLSKLKAWGQVPFSLAGQDGRQYLVKMRLVGSAPGPAAAASGQGSTAERLIREFSQLARQQEVRWNFDLQLMSRSDDPYDARQAWEGPWFTAGELVVPQIVDEAQAKRSWEEAEKTRFNVWKNKEPESSAASREVFRPWGELNRARRKPYDIAGANRGCPYRETLSAASKA